MTSKDNGEVEDDGYVEDGTRLLWTSFPRDVRLLTRIVPFAGYSWEQRKQRTWEALKEDADGNLLVPTSRRKRIRRRSYHVEPSVQRGMLRNLILALDMSSSMKEGDIKPNRYDATVQYVKQFVQSYLDRNPLCNIGIIVARDAVASVVSELSGVSQRHEEKLSAITPQGSFSLRNILLLAANKLKDVPSYMTKEVLLIQSSLNTSDASSVLDTMEKLKKENVRCSVVSLSSEVYVFKALTRLTKGTFGVCLDKTHFKELLFRHITPLPSVSERRETPKTHFVKMGFPKHEFSVFKSLCACHHKFSSDGFFCPTCQTKVCSLPTTCPVCGLRLVSSSHLARSYHHLFPVPPFLEDNRPKNENAESMSCLGCTRQISSTDVTSRCAKCQSIFCSDCDAFIHESLHNCPGCAL